MTTETFNNFSHIEYTPLRVFNLTIMFNNIIEDFGKEIAAEYIEQFSQADRKMMFVMQNYIRKFGYDAAKKEVTKNVEFSD